MIYTTEPNSAEKALALRWARSVAVAPKTPSEVAHIVAGALAEYREILMPNPEKSAVELTVRETQILRGMAQGLSNRQLGAQLSIAEDTVKTLNKRLFQKLDANNRHHAVAIGIRYGLVQ